MSTPSPAAIARFFAIGIFFGALGHSAWLAPLPFVGFCAGAMAVVSALRRAFCPAALLLGFSITFLLFDHHLLPIIEDDLALRGIRRIEGTVRDTTESTGRTTLLLDQLTVIGQDERRDELGTMRVSSDRYPRHRLGERLQFDCLLRPATSPAVRTALRVRDQVRAVCVDPTNQQTVALPGMIPTAIEGVRRTLLSLVHRALPAPSSELGAGLLLGAADAPLPSAVAEQFRRTGTSHIVAASGYNVAVVAAWCMAALSLLRVHRRPRLVLGVFAIWCYVLLAGGSAPVVRAGTMATAVCAAKLLGRASTAGHTLLLAGAIMLLTNPSLLVFDIGFELTLAATVGLIVVGPRLRERMPFLAGRGMLIQTLTDTLAAVLSTIPIILWRFGTLSLAAVPVNILVVPVVPVAMAATALVLPIGLLLPALAPYAGLIAWLPLSYILQTTRIISTLPLASVAIGDFPWWAMVILYGLLLVWLWPPLVIRTTNRLATFERWTVNEV